MIRCARQRLGRGERGQVAGIEALPFGLLIFTVGTLFIVNLWGVVDTKFAADAASRAATRHLVETARTDTDTATLIAEARARAEATMADHGRVQAVTLEVDAGDGSLTRCRRIVVTLRTSVPIIRLPFIGAYGDAFDVTATHAELVDPNRSGVGGTADCIR